MYHYDNTPLFCFTALRIVTRCHVGSSPSYSREQSSVTIRIFIYYKPSYADKSEVGLILPFRPQTDVSFEKICFSGPKQNPTFFVKQHPQNYHFLTPFSPTHL